MMSATMRPPFPFPRFSFPVPRSLFPLCSEQRQRHSRVRRPVAARIVDLKLRVQRARRLAADAKIRLPGQRPPGHLEDVEALRHLRREIAGAVLSALVVVAIGQRPAPAERRRARRLPLHGVPRPANEVGAADLHVFRAIESEVEAHRQREHRREADAHAVDDGRVVRLLPLGLAIILRRAVDAIGEAPPVALPVEAEAVHGVY